MHRAGGASRTAKLVSNHLLPRQCSCYGEANGAASQELRRVSQRPTAAQDTVACM
jgi:hypothetical protein